MELTRAPGRGFRSDVRRVAIPCLAVLAAAAGARALAGPPSRTVDFARELRPILADRCFACHGPDKEQRKAKLRLDTREGLARVHDGKALVVPGKPDESEIVARVSQSDPEERMPPPGQKPLSAAEIEVIREWIAQGAVWREHWAFVPPPWPAPPPAASAAGAQTTVDGFIAARLEAAGLEPAAEADRHDLVRRVTLDLTGLPPAPEEADAFAADVDPAAYDRLVDRLLASPAYGEHMARHWLDAARYGDTHGLHLDNLRVMWPYRDWVVGAFNAGIGYDRFAVEQLAGDLLPSASLSEQVASGFNRCHVTTSEGGSIEEEVYVRNVVDRVDTTATVFLGLSAGCSVCHDHKFDPMTTKEYYQLFAFFNSLDDSPLDGNAAIYPPVLAVPTPAQAEAREALERQVAAVEREARESAATFPYAEPAAEGRAPAGPREVVWIDDELPDGKAEPDWPWSPGNAASGSRAFSLAATGIQQLVFSDARQPLVVGEGDTLFASVYLDPSEPPQTVMLQWNDGSWEHRAFWGEDRIDWGAAGTPSRRAMGPLPEKGTWVKLEVPAASVGLAPGARVAGWAFTQHGGKARWDRAGLRTRDPSRLSFDSLAAWRDAVRAAKSTALPQDVQALVARGAETCTPDEERRVREYFVEHVYSGAKEHFARLHTRRDDLRRQAGELEKSLPTTLVSKERDKPRPSYILKRGAYDQHGDQVERATPAFLPPMSADLPRDRLGFARWLTDPAHPLASRVAVNRFWQQLFGAGIVRTAEDFGSQGEPPSHPELLDWLAVEFVNSGWDVKTLMRQLVLSAAYRRSSRVSDAMLAKDAENRLLARGPRFRLDAEVLRDQSLTASGLLVRVMGGPSVKPPQPAGLWEAVGYTSSNTARFAADDGERVLRRSVYTFWKRTSPPPQMTTFDAASREACRVRRERTNTPLQALLLMNEEQQVEAARRLAVRVLREAGPADRERAERMFRLVAVRPPSPADLDDILGLLGAEIAAYRAAPEAAAALVGSSAADAIAGLDPRPGPAELAAWTVVANLVLNLDEAVTKG